MSTKTDDKIEIERFIPAPPERVFAAWTDPEEAKHWFGPEGVQASEVKMDLRVGGRYAISIPQEDGETWTVSGEYREIVPPARLVYTWQWEDDAAWENVESVITIDFIAKAGGTEIRLTHEGFPTAESRNNHSRGWPSVLDKLEKRVAA